MILNLFHYLGCSRLWAAFSLEMFHVASELDGESTFDGQNWALIRFDGLSSAGTFESAKAQEVRETSGHSDPEGTKFRAGETGPSRRPHDQSW